MLANCDTWLELHGSKIPAVLLVTGSVHTDILCFQQRAPAPTQGLCGCAQALQQAGPFGGVKTIEPICYIAVTCDQVAQSFFAAEDSNVCAPGAPPRSAKLSAATTVNHAARRGQILTQSSASCSVLCLSCNVAATTLNVTTTLLHSLQRHRRRHRVRRRRRHRRHAGGGGSRCWSLL